MPRTELRVCIVFELVLNDEQRAKGDEGGDELAAVVVERDEDDEKTMAGN